MADGTSPHLSDFHFDFPEPKSTVWSTWYANGDVKSGSSWKKIFKQNDPRNQNADGKRAK